MRSLSRAVVVGALALPLAFAGAGLAAAGAHDDIRGLDEGSDTPIAGALYQHNTEVSDDDQGTINTGINHDNAGSDQSESD